MRMRPRVRPVAAWLAILTLPVSCAGPAGGPFAAGGAPQCTAETARAPLPAGCGLVCRAELPVTFNGQDPLVTVWVNGHPASMIFDTGASRTAFTRAGAAALGLAPGRQESGHIVGVGGSQPLLVTNVDRIGLSFVQYSGIPAAVVQVGDGATPSGTEGFLGADLLHYYDVDLDLPHNLIRLYQGKACEGALPGWTSWDGVVPFDPGQPGHHVIVTATLAGRPVSVLLDTGAQDNGLRREAALRMGVPPAELSDNLGIHMMGLGPEKVPGTINSLPWFEIAGERTAPFETEIFEPLFNSPSLPFDLLLGETYLRNHKVWISYATGRVYFAHTW